MFRASKPHSLLLILGIAAVACGGNTVARDIVQDAGGVRDATLADPVAGDASISDAGLSDTTIADASEPTIVRYSGDPVIYYSDLINGPKTTGQHNNGAFVTIWGISFGETQGDSYVTIGGGEVSDYLVWTDQKISFQLGSQALSGDIVVHVSAQSSNGVPFTVNEGHVYFADLNSPNDPGTGSFDDPWRSPVSFYDQLTPGDILYLRGGLYAGHYGKSFMGADSQVMTGISGEPDAYIAWIAYPGEEVTFRWGKGRHFLFIDKADSSPAHYQVVSQIVMDGDGASAVGGVTAGGWYQSDENGAGHLRIVGCRITNCAKGDSTTMTGHVRFTNDGSKLLGTEIDNCGLLETPFNNNHLVYIQCGADNIEIAHNDFHHSAAGHCIQVHADNPGRYTYENIRIHSNVISGAAAPGSLRGPTVSNVEPDTTVYFYNNLVMKTGWFSGFNLVVGTAHIYNNTFYDIGGEGVVALKNTSEKHMYLHDNILWSNGEVPYVKFGAYSGERPDWDFITASHNIYFGNGPGPEQDELGISSDPLLREPEEGNYYPQSDSPVCQAAELIGAFPCLSE